MFPQSKPVAVGKIWTGDELTYSAIEQNLAAEAQAASGMIRSVQRQTANLGKPILPIVDISACRPSHHIGGGGSRSDRLPVIRCVMPQHSVAIEAHFAVCAIAKWLVLRLTAAA